MGIPYNLARILTYFQRKIEAYDIVREFVNFEPIITNTEKYSFVGVFIPPTDQELMLFDEGEISQGVMMVYVPSKIVLHVNNSILSEQSIGKQSIVIFDGMDFRVKNVSNRAIDGMYRKYALTRFMKERINAGNG